MGENTTQQDANISKLFKSKGNRNRQNIRKRAPTTETIEKEEVNIKTLPTKKNKKKEDSEDSDKSDNEAIFYSNKVAVDFQADQSSLLQSKLKEQISGATATIEIDTEFSKDGRALAESKLLNKQVVSSKGDNTYKGQNNYNTYIQKKENNGQLANSKMKAGPIRASNNIRITNRFDYQPDICKDYKETGFCGYGDSCKFLHDRGDYKSGWQLEREWEEEQTAKRERIMKGIKEAENEVTSSDEEEELPFACLICRKSFTNPVVTKCGHYFCESCAIKKFQKTPKCFACGAPTNGIFDVAKNLIEKLNSMKKQVKESQSSDVEIAIEQNNQQDSGSDNDSE